MVCEGALKILWRSQDCSRGQWQGQAPTTSPLLHLPAVLLCVCSVLGTVRETDEQDMLPATEGLAHVRSVSGETLPEHLLQVRPAKSCFLSSGFRQWRLQGTASPRLAASPRAPQRKFRRVLLGPPPHTHTAPNLILHTTVDPTLPLGIILRTPGKTWGLTPEVPAGQDVTLAKPGRASRNPGPCTLFAFFPVGLPPVPAPSHGSHHSLPRPAFRPTAHQNTQCMNTPCSFHCGILSHNPLSAGKAVSSVPPLHKLTLILHDPFQYRFPRLFVTLCSQVP